MTAPEVVQLVRDQLPALTGYTIDTISKIGRDEKGWFVSVELLELKRVPSSGDVLASYDVHFDDSGLLMSYERTRRYQRSQLAA